jgi:hypothetical protein
VVLHGGATAVFSVSSLAEAARLADRAGNRVCITAWPDGPVVPKD